MGCRLGCIKETPFFVCFFVWLVWGFFVNAIIVDFKMLSQSEIIF